MNPTGGPPQLSEIMNELVSKVIVASHGRNVITGPLEAKKKAKAEIEQLILGIIGEDTGLDHPDGPMVIESTQNRLRAIQRQRLISLLGDKDEIV